jgi:hypothetical protein
VSRRSLSRANRNGHRGRSIPHRRPDGGVGENVRAVYRSLELPGKHPLKDAHAALDAAVLAAYGFDPKAELLKQLLDLNHAVAARERAGEPVTPPGVPSSYGDPSGLVSADCITAE